MPFLTRTGAFKTDFLLLTKIEQKQAAKALLFLANNLKHPSLQVHRIQGTVFWEAYVNKDIRIVYEQNADTLVFHAIGHHDILKKY